MSYFSHPLIICVLFAFLSASLVSCKKPEVSYYEIPAEESKQADTSMPANHPTIDRPEGEVPNMSDPAMANLIAAPGPNAELGLSWSIPENWIEGRSSSMRLGSFTVTKFPSLDISITRFPGDVGGLLSNVNRWRGQIGLAPSSLDVIKSELGKRASDSFTFEIVSLHNSDTEQKMLVALLAYEGNTWFFKMSGPSEAVEEEEMAFYGMVDSVAKEQR